MTLLEAFNALYERATEEERQEWEKHTRDFWIPEAEALQNKIQEVLDRAASDLTISELLGEEMITLLGDIEIQLKGLMVCLI